MVGWDEWDDLEPDGSRGAGWREEKAEKKRKLREWREEKRRRERRKVAVELGEVIGEQEVLMEIRRIAMAGVMPRREQYDYARGARYPDAERVCEILGCEWEGVAVIVGLVVKWR